LRAFLFRPEQAPVQGARLLFPVLRTGAASAGGTKREMIGYLRSRYNLTPDEYRAKWHLPRDYPMVAPNYAERRSQFAKKIGLGRKPKPAKPKRKRA